MKATLSVRECGFRRKFYNVKFYLNSQLGKYSNTLPCQFSHGFYSPNVLSWVKSF